MKQFTYDYSRPYFSRDYFSNNLLKIELTAGKRRIYRTVPFMPHDDMIMLIIQEGSGRMTINERQFEIKRGQMFCISPFHRYMMEPCPDESVLMWECHFSIGASMYVSACPYNPIKTLYMPGELTMANLEYNVPVISDHDGGNLS